MPSLNRRFAAGLATFAVAGSLLPLAMSPANAASTALAYTCQVPTLGAKAVSVTLDTNVADKSYVGSTAAINATANLTIPVEVVQAWYDAGYRQASGSVKLNATAGSTAISATMNVPATALPLATASTPTPAPATPTPTTTPAPVAAKAKELPLALTGPVSGLSFANAGDLVLKGGALDFTLSMKKADNSAVALAPFSCTPNATPVQDLTLDKALVVSKSTVALSGPVAIDYGAPAAFTATVTTPGMATSGTVKFTAGSATADVPVVNGKATWSVPVTQAVGNYQVTAAYVPAAADAAKVEVSSATQALVIAKDDAKAIVKIRKSANRATLTIVVDSVQGQIVTGDAKVTLIRRGKAVSTQTVTLKDGDGVVKLSSLTRGRYKVTVEYAGDAAMNPTKTTRGFWIKRG